MRVYICSRYRSSRPSEFELYQQYTKRVSREVALAGHTVITPHLYIPQFLDDTDADEREIGMKACLDLLEMCDVILVNAKYGVSEGMQREYEHALKIGMKRYRAENIEEISKIIEMIEKESDDNLH